jgi:nucleoside-diphosphate-sugar epimerase
MTANVVLTGGTGFVGRHVARELVARGCAVTCIVRSGTAGRLPSDVTEVAEVLEVEDLFAQSAGWWSEILPAGTRVVHTAWTAAPDKYINDPANLDCLAGTIAMAQGAIAAGVAKVVGIGTCIEYRLRDAPLDIDMPLDPKSPYAGAKAAAFLALSTALTQAGIAFAWCRLFYLHGEGEHPGRLVASLHNRLARGQVVELTEGHQTRDFLDVVEGARRIVAVALGETTGPVNICSGQPVTVRELALRIAGQYGREDLLRFGVRAENPFDPAFVVGIPTDLGQGSPV